MENKNTFETEVEHPFSFLNEIDVQEHFAELNMGLLEGRHIDSSDVNYYKLLTEYWIEFGYYYENLYQLKLTKAINGNYCYLDFFEAGLGKFSNSDRRKQLTELQTVYGLMLLKMYLDRGFEKDKTISWEDLRKELLEGEDSSVYKRVFFNVEADREHFTEKELSSFFDRLNKALKRFEQMGWVNVIIRGGHDVKFSIRESIMRMALFYKNEIENFEEFATQYLKYQSD